jgi:hypothetical protein
MRAPDAAASGVSQRDPAGGQATATKGCSTAGAGIGAGVRTGAVDGVMEGAGAVPQAHATMVASAKAGISRRGNVMVPRA